MAIDYDDPKFKDTQDLILKSDLPEKTKQEMVDWLYDLYEQWYDA